VVLESCENFSEPGARQKKAQLQTISKAANVYEDGSIIWSSEVKILIKERFRLNPSLTMSR
jgi:hypothetical protein